MALVVVPKAQQRRGMDRDEHGHAFCARLDALRVLRGHETVNAWQDAARAGRIESVVRDLLVTHYDPIYLQSIRRNFPGTAAPLARIAWDGSDAALASAADEAARAAPRRTGSAIA